MTKAAQPIASPSAAGLAALESDPALRDDPRLLEDARFLGAVHAQLVASLGPEEAASALLQMGFLHGLRDARRVVEAQPGAAAPRVPFRALPGADRGAPLDLEGSWIEALEAEAHVGALGPATAPCCFASAGYASGWLSGLFGADVVAIETGCAASGALRCSFHAREAAGWTGSPDPRVAHALAALDFPRLRQIAALDAPEPRALRDDEFDYEAPVIHVWGPVMVVPFSGPEDTIAAVELIGRDRSAREVAVVVVDLAGVVVDEEFGSLALERVLEAIESWGAEALLAGVSPLSEAAVAGLEARHLVLAKALPDAIALAFQIADAQRRAC